MSPLDPRTAATARIAELGWFMIVAATIVCLVVFGALFLALRAGRRRGGLPSRDETGGSGVVVIAGMVLPGIVIAATLAYTILVLRDVAGAAGAGGLHAAHDAHDAGSTSGAGEALSVRLVARQWWWEIVYPTEQVVTANEIHVPAGTPITLSVTSQDVIHSFWVPQIAGKVDVIPGETNAITFRVDQPGVYRGQCAEFCGLQHAHMHLYLFVDSPADFAAWLAAQRRVPSPPTDSLVAQGQRLFTTTSCAQCHSIRGTSASGTSGPDLTHVSSRRTLGAGAHENTPATLARWVAQPQAMKPGNKMPNPNLSEGETRAVAAYLESLE